jgi:hypothetical protein
MEVSNALRHVYNSIDTQKQWRRAVDGLRAMTEQERAYVWKLFSSDNLKLESPAALIIHSQYKALFKSAVREAKEDDIHACSDRTDNNTMELLKEYRERLDEALGSQPSTPGLQAHALKQQGGADDLKAAVDDLRADVTGMWEKAVAENSALATAIENLSGVFVNEMSEHAVRIDKTRMIASECVTLNVETHGAIAKLDSKIQANTEAFETFKTYQENENKLHANSILDFNLNVEKNTKSIDTLHGEQVAFNQEFRDALVSLKSEEIPIDLGPLETRIGEIETKTDALSSSSKILLTKQETDHVDIEKIKGDVQLSLESYASLVSSNKRTEENQTKLDKAVQELIARPETTTVSEDDPVIKGLNGQLKTKGVEYRALLATFKERQLEIENLKIKLQQLETYLETKRSAEGGDEDPEKEQLRIEVTKVCTAANAALREKEEKLENDILRLKKRCDQLIKMTLPKATIQRGDRGFGDLTLFEIQDSNPPSAAAVQKAK